ncbi:DUF3306 domain-containing protein [Bosea sp. (in: a-proteobacteria)]|uniref:DUF3306 domain-containing protein n=1 Tax=Bosea sp. (in: a-proteobacteria) TaxID=1871050 RepID=UPI00273738C8|nr:DUF3306 domain-containing protein [Bosea sp. (in: a-proteobacteria)]MDP3407072.1 DUF3306 domain-containing protein [Bosea sp. (in: a-proteobacteria)]
MSAGSPEDEGFLSRWSRRKRELVERDEAAPALPPAAEVPATARPTDPEVAEVAEPEPVEPPSLDLIDKDFDLASWLKQNVPEAWKLAAMRRAWENDPAIAGFENPARDYALDWNTPGMAPGYGPLTESDDVGAMVRSIFGEPPPAEAQTLAGHEGAGDGMSHQLSSNYENDALNAAARDDAAEEGGAVSVRLSEESEITADPAPLPEIAAQPVYAAVQQTADPAIVSPRGRKRGGGAIPI